MFLELFLTPGLVWPITHGVTGAYIGNLYGMPLIGGVVGVVIGVFTSLKVCKRREMSATEILAALLLIIALLGSSHMSPPFMLLLLVSTSTLPLIKSILLDSLAIDEDKKKDG